jgi:hypothetical protein
LVTFLKANNNNKALTTLDAIKLFGTPSRVRCDYDVENVDVCTYMEGIRGVNRGSAIKGKSCHHQRIERLWVDVWDNVLNNNHPVSTEHNRSPNQLFIKGVLANAKSNLKSIEELIQDAGSTNDSYYQVLLEEYGVEDVDNSDDDDDDDNDDAIISVIDVHILCEDKRQEICYYIIVLYSVLMYFAVEKKKKINKKIKKEICEEVNPLLNISSLEYGVELFKKTVELLNLD